MEKNGNLVLHSVEALNTFDSASRPVEDHINQYLKHKQGLGDGEQTFVVEVFSGCVRYNRVLKTVTDGFYNRDGSGCLRSEENLYKVVAYLALFRLDELGMSHFRRLIHSLNLAKMYRFLNFALCEKNLVTWMKDEWSKHYDRSFVQTTLLSPILRWLPEVEEMICHLKKKLDAKIKLKKPELKTTDITPFKLTEPRPRSIPMPEPIPKLKPHLPVPKSTYKEPNEFEQLSEKRYNNRRKAEERLMEASKVQFACANPEKSEKANRIMNEIEEEKNEKLMFNISKANKLPTSAMEDNSIPFKLNTAAILREGVLYKQREAKEIEKIEKLEAGAFDDRQFLDWQHRMLTHDEESAQAVREKRKVANLISREEAFLARQHVADENRRRVEEMRAEAEVLMRDWMREQLKEEEATRTRKQKVINSKEQTKQAKKKLQAYKAKIVQDVIKENRELMQQALEEAEKEMQAKMDVIRQIRAMESLPPNRFKPVDLASNAGHGFLSEMSIVELRERLSLLRMQTFEETEEKRDKILATKQAKDEALMSTLTTIARHRTENSRASAIKLEERKKREKPTPEIKDERLNDLQRRLEAKQAERKMVQQRNQAKTAPPTERMRFYNSHARVTNMIYSPPISHINAM